MSSFSHIRKLRDESTQANGKESKNDVNDVSMMSHDVQRRCEAEEHKAAKKRAREDRTYYEALKFLDTKYIALVR